MLVPRPATVAALTHPYDGVMEGEPAGGTALFQKGADVVVSVWVVPNATRSEIVGLHGDALRIRVAQPPERGRASEAVRRLLAEGLAVPVDLVAGARSRRKRFVVRGVRLADVARRLGIPGPEEPEPT
jgi:uncharacterized protein (TIGR00251 family)